VLPDIAEKLPKGEVMDYTFLGQRGKPVESSVVIYLTAELARTAAIAYQHGYSTSRYITAATPLCVFATSSWLSDTRPRMRSGVR